MRNKKKIHDEIKAKRAEIQKLLHEYNQLKEDPAIFLAEWLHSRNCKSNHTDHCSWFYTENDPDSWETDSTRKRYLYQAKELIKKMKFSLVGTRYNTDHALVKFYLEIHGAEYDY